MRRSVQCILNSVAVPSGNGYQNTRSHSEGARCPGLNSQARKRYQIRHIATIERQIENALGLDDLTNARSSRFNQRRVRLNLDRFTHLADLQRHIDNRITVDLQHNSSLCKCAKARESRF